MATKPNKAKRALFTAILLLVATGIVAIIAIGSIRGSSGAPAQQADTPETRATELTAGDSTTPSTSTARAPTPSPQTPPAPPESPTLPSALEDAPVASQTESQPAPSTPTPTLGQITGLRARVFDAPAPFASLGAIEPAGQWKYDIAFSPYGAGVESIVFADYFEEVNQQNHYAVQERKSAGGVAVVSLAAVGVELSIGGEAGVFVDLRRPSTLGTIWRELSPGEFEAIIEDAEGNPVARVHKKYELRPGSFELVVRQRLDNLTQRPMRYTWYQYGPLDLPKETTGYNLPTRRFRYGFLLSRQRDPSQQVVLADTKLLPREKLIDRQVFDREPLWPRDEDLKNQRTLAWVAMTSRYFAFVVHAPIDPDDATNPGVSVEKDFDLARRVDRVVVGFKGDPNQSVVLQLTSAPGDIPAGGSADISFGAYAGPLSKQVMRSEPIANALNLQDMVIHNIGGMCAPCTFQWLTRPLLWFLRIAHNYIVFDWALAIILLVLVVRTILHPITRRSQIAMTRFGKQMQALGPKQQKLKEKYKDDPKRLQQEVAKLMKEEGVNFTGALGCLPMFLQTPVWIALYAMLYFAYELRHQPAFFGVVQKLTNGQWAFLGDLSAPDHFIEFGRAFNVPLISGLMGPITGLNILPLVLGVVFFIQQKYLTPPTSATMTPEQQAQQKIIKVMMVIMFPVFVFNAPSGLTLYFVTNSTLGILESRWIRAHINQLDLEPKKPTSAAPGRKRVANTAKQGMANPFAKKQDKGQRRFKDRDGR